MDTPASFDRAHQLREDPDALETLLAKHDSLLVPVHHGRTPVRSVPAGDFSIAAAPRLLDDAQEVVFLGLYEERGIFALDVSNLDEDRVLAGSERGSELQDLRLTAATLPAWQSHVVAYARAILHFHSTHAFCGSCGGDTRPRKGGHVRMCNRCQRELFPRTDPAVLVLVHHGDRVLLGRQPSWPKGMYSTLAGFVEPGESLESAVRREVLEEAGIEVADIRYQGSQPWPFPSSLMVGFTATATTTAITLDDELEDARFFSLQELRAPKSPDFFTPPPYALAGQLIAAFLARMTA